MATDGATAQAKAALRTRLLAARRARSATELAALRASLVSVVLDRVRTSGWRTVAAYEPLRTEPGSTELLAALAAAGVDVLVPITLPDRDLDWSRWRCAESLGVGAVGSADAVLVPALAVDATGTRLGRGGGSYDRALARTDAVRAALVFADELLESVPRDPWDEPVHLALTPSGGRTVGNTGVASGD